MSTTSYAGVSKGWESMKGNVHTKGTPTIGCCPRRMQFRELKSYVSSEVCLVFVGGVWFLDGVTDPIYLMIWIDWDWESSIYYNYYALMTGQHVSKTGVICSSCFLVWSARLASMIQTGLGRRNKGTLIEEMKERILQKSRNLDSPNTNRPTHCPSL